MRVFHVSMWPGEGVQVWGQTLVYVSPGSFFFFFFKDETNIESNRCGGELTALYGVGGPYPIS